MTTLFLNDEPSSLALHLYVICSGLEEKITIKKENEKKKYPFLKQGKIIHSKLF
jgi:hypothetical protein